MQIFSSIVGILAGILAVWMGISFLGINSFYMRQEVTFGGDFYTEIYDVVESLRGRMNSIENTITEAVGWLFVFIGLTDICAFGCVLSKSNAKNQGHTDKEYASRTSDEPANSTLQ